MIASPGHADPNVTRRVIVLGSTGSVGTQSLEVIAHLNTLAGGERFRVVGLAAGRNAALLHEQARAFHVLELALCEPSDNGAARTGPDAAERLVREVEADTVIAAIDGIAGLRSTLAAAELGRHIALANKESLVAGGCLITAAARSSGATLLPVDSEHSAIWQALVGLRAAPCPLLPPLQLGLDVAKIWLTASGGPFRQQPLAEVYNAPRERALKHPTWAMGAKVTLDSATLVNKAFEMIEAHWLFGVGSDRLGVLIHPQSVVHSIVELADGAQLAQLGSADMRVPIQFALTHPDHAPNAARRLDWSRLSTLDFAVADEARFEAIALARRVIERGGNAGAVFTAASQELSELYRAGSGGVAFGQLVSIAAEAVECVPHAPIASLDDVLQAARAARAFVRDKLSLAAHAASGRRSPDA